MKPIHSISGANLLIVANNAGGTAKTTYAAEACVACTMHGIPYRLVTFDGSSHALNRIFRGSGVHCLAKSNGETQLDSFKCQIDEARKGGEIIIADMPSCIAEPYNPIMKTLSDSQILADFESIGLLVPIGTSYHSIEGALDALAAYKAAGIKHDRGLVRGWRSDPASPTWEAFPCIAELKAYFPFWDCSSYMQSMTEMMYAHDKFSEYPALDKLHAMFAERSGAMNVRERGQLRAAVAHLEKAKDAIFEQLLKPIIEKPAKTAKSE